MCDGSGTRVEEGWVGVVMKKHGLFDDNEVSQAVTDAGFSTNGACAQGRLSNRPPTGDQ